MRPALAFALLAMTAAAAHAQATINDCEKIQAADAYNQCLAKFGPSGKNLNMEPEKPGDVKGSAAEAAAGAGAPKGTSVRGRHGRGGRHGYTRHGSGGGRKHMTFTVRRRHR